MNRLGVVLVAVAFHRLLLTACVGSLVASEQPDDSASASSQGTPAARTNDRDTAAILRQAGVQGGLVVHVGCGDGRLTAGLHASGSYVVQGLDADPAHAAAARQHVRSLGLADKVWIEKWTGPQLPYADNLVNLIVVNGQLLVGSRPLAVAREELLRVLCPGGVAVFATDDGQLTTDN